MLSELQQLLERLRDALDSARAHRDDVEGDVEPAQLGPRREPDGRRAAQAALLLVRDHVERVAEPRPALLLHLDEAERAAAPRDQVELVAARPDVRAEDPPAAEPVPPERAALGGPSPRRRRLPGRSRAPGS